MDGSGNIRLERNPNFWLGILAHPQVRHVMRGLDLSAGVEAVIRNTTVLPYATANGGYVFVQMDPLGRVFDLHAVYTPEGRGREALDGLKAALDAVGADLIIAFETDDAMSRPPLSFGFRPAGEAVETGLGSVRTWVLTREAWEASKVRARMH